MFTPHWAGVVGFMVFSRQGSEFQSHSILGVRVGCMYTLHWKSGWVYFGYFPLGMFVFFFLYRFLPEKGKIYNIKRRKNYQGKAK